jgi:DeoR/GlpR family transcriptional regulator of sugar metabolism
MLTAQRRQIILDRLAITGQVSVTTLSLEWAVSEDTVRRDLRDLASEGLVQRVHGGALPVSPALGNYERREVLSIDSKTRLAKAGANLIQAGLVVAIDGGTTNLQLVRAIPKELVCTIVTHSPIIAAELRWHNNVEVLLIGGKIFRHSQVALGAETAQAISRLRIDLFFLGATGIQAETGITTGDWDEAAIKRAFCDAAADTILLLSPEKLGAAAPYQILPIEKLSVLVVDADAPETAISVFQHKGVEIIRAGNH